jgi:Ca-activated chloride channel family protein
MFDSNISEHRTEALPESARQGGGQQGGGQQNNQYWHYGFAAPGATNGNAVPNFGLKIDLNANGAVPGQGGQVDGREGLDRYYRGRDADRLGELGDVQEGKLAGDGEIQDHLALLPQRTIEAEKHLKDQNEARYAEDRAHNTEAYARIYDNRFLRPLDAPLSTFSIDVDTAAYANMRRFLKQGSLPPADSVRIEELVNYFSYQYAPPAEQDADKPFAVHTEVTACPWNPEHRLVRIALKGREVKVDTRPPSNLVFLLDVSGSMDEPNKLPLVKRAMHLLVEKLGENDRVAIVVYAGASGLVLPSTTANNRETILAAIDNLTPGGSTNGASGIELAYQIAAANQIKAGVNRVILATDGDFNVGVTNDGDLTRLIEEKAKTGVFLTVLGFGMGNLKDSTLERLADKGNGNYGYIDTENEARKLLVEQLSGTLITIAKDVKLQIELNPARVAAYRLLGYENRLLAAEDFNDDTKDAGEIGAGHAVTAFYEIVPVAPPAAQQQGAAEQQAADKPADDKPAEATAPAETTPVDPLKYQRPAELTDAARGTPELLTLKLRYKEPEGTTSKLLEFSVADGDKPIGQATEDTRFAASVALFGMLLRQSPHAGSGTLAAVLEMADSSRQNDEHGYRAEFVELVKQATTLAKPQQ